ncbi:PE domain-containing protein [Saccharopolyspora sp. TS4A08]|uniref:PE domain-containing protein n=1 Tax=Saccharopolyspora ipomoeae TaxID=3042027 RepID=A0ABT6PHB5_9PSEU|nr:PE domain-containing protein [Saccharopolyspora sp. TS4A08]MDI2027393.1 PE domain-containing protein [Saccharopolyspora sp. TS4A08]
MTFPNIWGQIGETITNIGEKAAYAQAQAAGGSMRIQPDKVDELARFFDDEAEKLENREADITMLAEVPAPGSDPVSTGSATTFGQVGAGGPNAYMENYAKLAVVFRDAANALRQSAQQVRTDDDTASLSFKS